MARQDSCVVQFVFFLVNSPMSFVTFHYKITKKLLGIAWNAGPGVGLVTVLVVG